MAKKPIPKPKASSSLRQAEIERFAAITPEQRKAMLEDTARRQDAASTRGK